MQLNNYTVIVVFIGIYIGIDTGIYLLKYIYWHMY